MKKIVLVSACALALSSASAIAQTTNQPAAGASKDTSPATQSTTGAAGMKDKRGDSKGMTPSGGGANTNNMGSQAGGGAGGGSGGK